ncbi:hypothetical protein FJT64_002104 [Amphibalanus amphitrite]|uniref:Uncharacterized protein n=2 Tax=Amphibalanus amphitrite TaxID=1232801 RepID=A0A6A4WZB3_AMPAM|nr:hypothetical protein FJT64_002104 [Amphibalanus amphitrite]
MGSSDQPLRRHVLEAPQPQEMQMRAALVLCCLLAAAAAAPQFFRPGQFQFNRPGQATGSAAGNVVSGTSSGPGGTSTVTQVSAEAGGSVRGPGASSTNSASASNVNAQTPFGNFQQSNTNANSNQSSGGGRRPCFGFFCRPGK